MFDGVDPGAAPFYVPPEAWPAFAPRLAGYLDRMATGSHGRYAAPDIYRAIMLGEFHAWVALDGPEIVCFMLTQIIRYPRGDALRCVGIVGHRPKRWVHLLADVETAARDYFKCRWMEALAQPGHERMLQTSGWEVTHYLSEKTL